VATSKEVDAVLKLDAEARYGFLIRRVADFEQAWGLRSSRGWVCLADDAGALLFPVWPHAEYVERCRELGDTDDEPSSIDLEYLLDVLLPGMASEGTMIAAFPTPSGKGVPVTAERFREDLVRECSQYDAD
jgi:hypothetical protein